MPKNVLKLIQLKLNGILVTLGRYTAWKFESLFPICFSRYMLIQIGIPKAVLERFLPIKLQNVEKSCS